MRARQTVRAFLCCSITAVILAGSVPAGSAPVHIWSYGYGGPNIDHGDAVAMDAFGNVYMTGYTYSDIDFGGGLHLNAGMSDIFVAKFDPWGNRIWSALYGDADYQEGNAIAIDPSGDVILAGKFQGSVNFGGGNLTSAGLDDIWVAKIHSNGTHVWSKRFGDSSTQYALSITTDGAGDVYLFGYFAGTVDFGGGPLTATGGYDVYVAKLGGTNGSHHWSRHFSGSDADWAECIEVDGTGNVYLTGFFNGTIDL